MSENYQVPGAEPRRFMFPFAAVPKGARVVIYGGGIVGKTYVQEIRRTGHCHVVALVDKKARQVHIDGVRVVTLEKICHERYDYLLIALERQDWAVGIWRDLLGMGGREKMRWIDPCKTSFIVTTFFNNLSKGS